MAPVTASRRDAPPAASVIIPALNAAATLPCQLDALADQQDAPPFEVIVADNGSTDDTRPTAAAYHGVLDLLLIDASARPGPGPARNTGARRANAPLVLFCDADDRVGRRWVRGLVDELQRHRLVTGPVIPAGPAPVTAIPDDFPTPPPGVTRRFVNRVPYAAANNLGIRRAYFESLNGFDERMVRSEDLDLCVRAYLDGCGIGWAAEAVILRSERAMLRHVARQWFDWGYYDAFAYRKFRYRIEPPLTVAEIVRPYLALAGRSYRLATRQRRWWVRNAAYRAGRLTGSVRAGVFCP